MKLPNGFLYQRQTKPPLLGSVLALSLVANRDETSQTILPGWFSWYISSLQSHPILKNSIPHALSFLVPGSGSPVFVSYPPPPNFPFPACISLIFCMSQSSCRLVLNPSSHSWFLSQCPLLLGFPVMLINCVQTPFLRFLLKLTVSGNVLLNFSCIRHSEDKIVK